jgi:hypothetical protein
MRVYGTFVRVAVEEAWTVKLIVKRLISSLDSNVHAVTVVSAAHGGLVTVGAIPPC